MQDIIIYDTSLRDGLQHVDPNEYSTTRKIVIFEHIKSIYKPHNIEVGSLCSPHVLPIMNDTLTIYNHAIREHDIQNVPKYDKSNVYVLIPSFSKLQKAIDAGITSMSFITSVSNIFQLQNTQKSLLDTKREFEDMFIALQREPGYETYRKKLYISCISECPLAGLIDIHTIIEELQFYHTHYQFDELCLSDTCGTLTYTDFVTIVENSQIPTSMFSLHLHVSPTNMTNVENILLYCFSNGIHRFDVSLLETGGCSVTMSKDQMLPNLSYDTLYDTYQKYQQTLQ